MRCWTEKIGRHTVRFIVIGAALSSLLPVIAKADYPTKPIRMVVGFTASGGADTTARIIAVKLSDLLGQRVIVDNRPGAAGNIATELVAKAEPDGYTILMGTIAALAINPSLYRTKLPFDPIKDLAPIVRAVDSTNVPGVVSGSDLRNGLIRNNKTPEIASS